MNERTALSIGTSAFATHMFLAYLASELGPCRLLRGGRAEADVAGVGAVVEEDVLAKVAREHASLVLFFNVVEQVGVILEHLHGAVAAAVLPA